jgi:hypothetical protein
MKYKLTRLSLGLGLLVYGGLPSVAADWNSGFGGARDYSNGIPIPAPVPVLVPAPVPVPEIFRYYLRADLGASFVNNGISVSESGLIFGASDSVAPFGTSAFTKRHDDAVGVLGTIGAGLYISPQFRADITVDFREQQDAQITDSYSYTQYRLVPGPATPTGLSVEGSSIDRTRFRGTVAMI